MSLVPGQHISAFVALSYRWGIDGGFRTIAGLLPVLQQPKSLEFPQIASGISPILKRAIHLVEELGERYLWADTLCIVQDDLTELSKQLNLMGAIYASATFTIVAADGDAQSGLAGLDGVPRSPHSAHKKQLVIAFGDEHIFIRPNHTGKYESQYYRRGWTFQEYFMSKRRLIFNKTEVHWECQSHAWEEHMDVATNPSAVLKRTENHASSIIEGVPDIRALGVILAEYNERILTYDTEALPGISGLLAVLSRTFTGGFLYGLPEMFFDKALAWYPSWSDRLTMGANLQRRVACGSNSGSAVAMGLPSWSYLGWRGNTSWMPESAFLVWGVGDETIPITEWYASDRPSGGKLRRIKSTWFDQREGYRALCDPLPPGWTRRKYVSGEKVRGQFDFGGHPHPDRGVRYVFSHISKPTRWFWHPIPIVEVNEHIPPVIPEQMEYVMCETKRAWLLAIRCESDREKIDDPLDYRGNEASTEKNLLGIFNVSGIRIGRLNLHHEDDLVQFPKEPEAGVLIELVAICRRRRVDGQSTNDNMKELLWSAPDDLEDYVVLWVEWKAGVAYRKAIGAVERKQWESQQLEDVSLVLG